MNDSDNPDDEYLPPGQVAFYGAHGWTSQNDRPSTSQTSRNHRTLSSQQSQDHVVSASQRSQNHGVSSSQLPQNHGVASRQPPQNHGATSSRAQNQASSTTQSRNQGVPMSQGFQNRASTSQSSHCQASSSQSPGASSQVLQNAAPKNSNWEKQVADLMQGVNFLREQIEEVANSGPGAVKNEDKKKKQKERLPCQLCHKTFANPTTLFRHYKTVHSELNPDERFGYTVNDTVLTLDDSVTQEHRCGICGYVSSNKNALDSHSFIVHSKDVDKCKVCGYKANSKNDLDDHSKIHSNNNNNGSVNDNNGTGIVNGNNNGRVNNVEAAKDQMYKCEECDCYYDDKNKFDKHTKDMHGFVFLCRICNKNFRFKDFEGHVRDSHPDVYKDKEETAKSNVIVENNVRTKTGRCIGFKCNKCNEKFTNKNEATRHAKIHKKEFRSRAVSNKQTNSQTCDTNTNKTVESVPTHNDIMYICEACDIATASYDVVVEHSQKHIFNPDIQFATNECDICDLKFEPICYDKHIDVHYENKDINKDSFKYLKYKYYLLLTNDWLNFFNMERDIVNRIISRSIYVETRSIKMRVVPGNPHFTNTLYQCRQCDNFVEPSTVTHHALNFDTCVRIPNSFPCNVCERSFNTELACDNHEAVHNNNESFRIVMFNDERDREFNYILNNTAPSVISQVATTNDEENNPIEKVIYKCLCGLCFVFEDSANNHIEICPGHDQKQICQKCSNLFNLHELVDHYCQHHLNENIRLITKSIVPPVIVVSDDESIEHSEAIEILSSDDENDNNDNEKLSQNREVTVEGDTKNEPQTPCTENVTRNNVTEERTLQTDLLVPTDTVREVPMDEDNEEHNQLMSDENSGHSHFEVSNDTNDEDSQNTIVSDENHTNPSIRDVAHRNEIKCVETDRLINPFFVRDRFEETIIADDRNNNLATKIDTTRLKIEAPEVHVKEEIPWHADEDTYMNWRPLRQNSNVTGTDTVIVDLDGILTDDEDEVMTPVNEHADAQENINNVTGINVNPEELVEEIDNTVVYNLQNIQNGVISNSNILSPVTDERNSIYNDDTMDMFIPNEMNAISREVAVLSERPRIINTDNIKIEDETKRNTRLITQSGRNENIFEDTEIEEITSNHTRLPFRNGANDIIKRIVVNNLEIQLSDQPSCSIF